MFFWSQRDLYTRQSNRDSQLTQKSPMHYVAFIRFVECGSKRDWKSKWRNRGRAIETYI